MGDERMRVMRVRSLLVAVLVFGIWSCYTAPVAYVPVREARFRSETTKTERIQLPLTAESRERLLTFFRAGGDTDRIGGEVVDPEIPGTLRWKTSRGRIRTGTGSRARPSGR
jgi:hypothetical protein